MSYWRVALSIAICAVCFEPTSASADDPQVIRRLTKHGRLSNGAARKVVSVVGKRMAKSADNFAPANDPLRVAVSQRLFGAPTPPDPMSSAKIRLRLFSGLNSWALETLFKPTGGQIANCQANYSLSKKQCEALVAASGTISVADARKLGGGAAGAPMRARAPLPQQQPRFAAQPAQGQSRFGKFNSGFRGQAAGQQRQFAAQPQQRQAFAARPAPQRQVAPRAVPARRPVANANTQMSTAAAYKARRAARMARLQEERAKKKQAAQAVATAAPAKAPAAKAPAAKPAEQVMEVDPEEAEAPAPKEEAAAPQLDEGFLDGLLDDPLGKK